MGTKLPTKIYQLQNTGQEKKGNKLKVQDYLTDAPNSKCRTSRGQDTVCSSVVYFIQDVPNLPFQVWLISADSEIWMQPKRADKTLPETRHTGFQCLTPYRDMNWSP